MYSYSASLMCSSILRWFTYLHRCYPNNQTSLFGKIRDRLQSLCLEAKRIEGYIEAKLSCGLMIRLHTRPIPSVSWTGDIHRNTEKERQFGDGRGKGAGVEPNHTTAKILVLYKSVNPLCLEVFIF